MSKFTDSVEAQAKREGLPGSIAISSGFCYTCPGCLESHDICCEHKGQALWESGDVIEEGNFSWSSCDLCGSSLGGDRYPAHFFTNDDSSKEIIHIEVCTDCVLYLANGDESEEWRKS